LHFKENELAITFTWQNETKFNQLMSNRGAFRTAPATPDMEFFKMFTQVSF
jgi:hypothetical protein